MKPAPPAPLTREAVFRQLDAVWRPICKRGFENGFATLSRPEQLFWAVWSLMGEVDNGGFCQYVFNSSLHEPTLPLEAFVEIGAFEAAKVVREFYSLLPGGRLDRRWEKHQDQLDQAVATLGEAEFERQTEALERRFYALEPEFIRLLFEYAHRHGLLQEPRD